MANLLVNATKNGMLNYLDNADFMSLHTGDPGTSGTNESTGGSPAYARKALTWSAAASGSKAISNSPVFDVPASTIAYVGMWDAVTSGTYFGHWDVTDEVFAAQGTYTVTSGSVSLT